MVKAAFDHAGLKRHSASPGTVCVEQILADGSVKAIFFDDKDRMPTRLRNDVLELLRSKREGCPNLKVIWAAVSMTDVVPRLHRNGERQGDEPERCSREFWGGGSVSTGRVGLGLRNMEGFGSAAQVASWSELAGNSGEYFRCVVSANGNSLFEQVEAVASGLQFVSAELMGDLIEGSPSLR